MRGLARIADPVEDLGGGEPEDGEPGEPLAPGAARALVVGPGGLFGAGEAFLGADPECAHDLPTEAGMVLEVTPDLAFDRAGLEIRRAEPAFRVGEFAAFLDALEQGFARRGGGEEERHAGGDGGLDVSERPGPFDFAKRGVYHDHLLGRDEARELQRHGL